MNLKTKVIMGRIFAVSEDGRNILGFNPKAFGKGVIDAVIPREVKGSMPIKVEKDIEASNTEKGLIGAIVLLMTKCVMNNIIEHKGNITGEEGVIFNVSEEKWDKCIIDTIGKEEKKYIITSGDDVMEFDFSCLAIMIMTYEALDEVSERLGYDKEHVLDFLKTFYHKALKNEKEW